MLKTKTIPVLLAVFCLIGSGPVVADQYDPRLEELFQDLRNAPNRGIGISIEDRIWAIWRLHDNPDYQSLMRAGIREMNSGALRAALNTFTRLIEMAPDFAEAWNKRATVHYLLENYQASEADIERTLMLEPKHFGALSGHGLVLMAQGDYYRAREAFQSALEVNPHMEGVMNNLEAIRQYLNENTI